MMAVAHQLQFEFASPTRPHLGDSYRERLTAVLSSDLDFHGASSRYASHSFHAFPAKFPPQLPQTFIQHLTRPGEVVLDPMMGSGTTVVEAVLAGREAVGSDIDPMALRISRVKAKPLAPGEARAAGQHVLQRAATHVWSDPAELARQLETSMDPKTRRFADYWFRPETQIELWALASEIRKVADPDVRAFLELVFSAMIITKSGGVSLALDLAHTRPHRVADKPLRSPLREFGRRLSRNISGLASLGGANGRTRLAFGNCQALPFASNLADLVVTSPPYASTAIDYMRAHKFSLIWFGYGVDYLSRLRSAYIGGESTKSFRFEELPPGTRAVVQEIGDLDHAKGQVLRRYYSEMTRSLSEILRVLKPGRAAVIVVGSSTMRGKDIRVSECLAEIGESVGFVVGGVGVRKLDRNRRMMPARLSHAPGSTIEQRMHEEFVLGLLKP